jgi:hypothetical protein
MASFPAFIARPLAGGALTMLLALGATTAHAQVVPKPAPAVPPVPKNVAYYMDGKLASQADMKAINPNSILSMNVLKEAADKEALGQASSDGVLLITTKNGVNSPEVQALNKRFPTRPASPEQLAAMDAAKAYVTQHYPTANIEHVVSAKGQTDRYNVTFTNNGQRVYLLFDGKGNPVEK